MTDSDRHDEIRELLVPYALRQLDAEQRSQVERALDADPELRAELEAFERVGAELVGTMPHRAAPPELKARVMAAVEAPAKREQITPSPVATSTAAASVLEPRVDELARRRARRTWILGPAVSSALAAACVILAIVAFDVSGDLDAANERLERIEAQVTDDGAPDGFLGATPYPVSTTDEFSTAKGSLIRVSEDKWVLAFNDVPDPDEGRSWQVWTASAAGEIRNIDQWRDGGSQIVVIDTGDIVEVMVSYERTTRPVPTPGGDPVADIKL